MESRNRGGYEEGNYTLFRKSTVYDFVHCEDPIKVCLCREREREPTVVTW
jgi:hypothetical protein